MSLKLDTDNKGIHMKVLSQDNLPVFRNASEVIRFLKKLRLKIKQDAKDLQVLDKVLASGFSITLNDEDNNSGYAEDSRRKFNTKDSALNNVSVKIDKKSKDLVAKHFESYSRYSNILETIDSSLHQWSETKADSRTYASLIKEAKLLKSEATSILKSSRKVLAKISDKTIPKNLDMLSRKLFESVTKEFTGNYESSTNTSILNIHDDILVYVRSLIMKNIYTSSGDIVPNYFITVYFVVNLENKSSEAWVNTSYTEMSPSSYSTGSQIVNVGQAIKAVDNLMEIDSFSSSMSNIDFTSDESTTVKKVDYTSLIPSFKKIQIGKNIVKIFTKAKAIDTRTISDIVVKLGSVLTTKKTKMSVGQGVYSIVKVPKTKDAKRILKEAELTIAAITSTSYHIYVIAHSSSELVTRILNIQTLLTDFELESKVDNKNNLFFYFGRKSSSELNNAVLSRKFIKTLKSDYGFSDKDIISWQKFNR